MNIVHDLRIKKGLQQKELALELGVSCAAVSNWEHQKSDPSGPRLRKLAEIFGVEENFVLGYGNSKPTLFVPENPATSGVSETEQIIEHVLNKLNIQQPTQTPEIRIVSGAMEKMSKEQQEQVVNVVRAMFANNPELFN